MNEMRREGPESVGFCAGFSTRDLADRVLPYVRHSRVPYLQYYPCTIMYSEYKICSLATAAAARVTSTGCR